MKRLVFVAALACACRGRVPGGSQAPADSAIEIKATALRASLSFAKFEGDVITECIDSTVTAETGRPDGAVDEAGLASRLEKFFSAAGMGRPGAVRLRATCRDQLGDRPLFASCEIAPLSSPGIALWMKEYFLSFPLVFSDDGAMRECLTMNGSWSSMSRQAPAFIEARMRFEGQRAEKRARKLFKASGIDPAGMGLDN